MTDENYLQMNEKFMTSQMNLSIMSHLFKNNAQVDSEYRQLKKISELFY